MSPFSFFGRERRTIDGIRLAILKTLDINSRSYESKLQQIETQYFVIDKRLEKIENALKVKVESLVF